MKNIRVAIIGAGPAGLSAALWLKKLGLTPIVFEKEAKTGGMQNFNFLKNDWVLGQVNATGIEVAESFYQHIMTEAIDVRVVSDIVGIQRVSGDVLLSMNNSEPCTVNALIIATGTRYVNSEILSNCDGFDSLPPTIVDARIIEGPYAFLHIEKMDKQNVVIFGAGDNAFENAQMLLAQGCSVTILARSYAKAQAKFIDSVMPNKQFTLIESATIEQINADQEKLQLLVRGKNKKISSNNVVDEDRVETCVLHASRLHILAGYQPNVESIADYISGGFSKKLVLDKQGYIEVDTFGRTSVQQIYAAGDICNIQFPCVVSAVAAGAQAAKTISQDFT